MNEPQAPNRSYNEQEPCIVGQHIDNESHLKVALYKTRTVCIDLGFNPIDTNKVVTAASELIRNVLKYAGNGQYCLCACTIEQSKGLEMIVSDQGPGIADIESAMREKSSTGGTLGLGLPGVERLMDSFTVKSTVGQGTTVTARKFL